MGKYSKVEGKLIAEVERYPVLSRTKDINYKNKTVKENAWQVVADTINRECDANFTGNKIEYLHSSHAGHFCLIFSQYVGSNFPADFL